MKTINDGGPAFPVWAVVESGSGWTGNVVQIVKETAQSVMILEKSWDGTWSTKPTRRAKHNVIATFLTEDAANALKLALRDINVERLNNERRLVERRAAVIKAARAKGGVE